MRADALTPRPGGGTKAGCLPYTTLDLFPALAPSPTVHRQQHRERSPVRKPLSSVGFDHALGTSALFRLSGASSTTPSAATKPLSLYHQSPAQLNQQLDDTLPRARDASGFLGSLRATTLLDYGFMREFSLLKRKPLRDRNLSRLSTESIYSMRTTQLALEQQGKRELSGHSERPAGKTDAAPSPKSAVLLWRDLSEFDLRKCHPAVVIAELHGHLQEQDVATLCVSTGYNRTELFALWARFKALCSIAVSPRGIDKDTFRRGLPQLALEDEFFIDRVFDILDADGSGILEWPEFIEALSALEKGDAETRVRFLFRVYDLSGDGSIHRSEIQRFFLASLLITPSDDVVAVASHIVDKIFMAVGRESSDTMRVQDALTYMHDNPGSADIYKLLGRTMITNHRLIVDKSAPAGSATSPVESR